MQEKAAADGSSDDVADEWMDGEKRGGGWWHLLRHDQLHSNMLNSFLLYACLYLFSALLS